MCGLAGVAGNTNMKIMDGFKDLLLITQLRGQDATGVFAVNHENTTVVSKTVGIPNELFDKKSFDAAIRPTPKLVAGHCRAKTVGENTKENAHPYDFDNLVGMHNGTLRNHYQIDGYDYKKTDSWTLYNHIDRFGIEETMAALDPDSAYALVWWDKNENRLNFLRNDKRPLWFAWTSDRKTMIWASEPWMFTAFARNVDLWDGKEKDKPDTNPYFQLPVDTLWSFSVDDRPKPGEKFMTFHQPKTIKAEGKKSVGFIPGHRGYGNQGHGGSVTSPFTMGSHKETPDEVIGRAEQRWGQRKPILDDDLSDLSKDASTTSNTSAKESEKTSSNVLDFRQGLTRGTSLSRRILSPLQKNSKDSRQSSNAGGTGISGVCSETELIPKAYLFPQVSVRDVANYEYISHKHTSSEISETEFSNRTGGKCSYCHKPIGGLSEVAAFTNKAMTGFVCTTCITPPEVQTEVKQEVA